MDDLKIMQSGGFGISKVHEIFILKKNNGILYWNFFCFPDHEYGEAQIDESKTQKRFWAKDQNKDDGLQEDLDNDSEYKTDDKTEEKARRSASCILFFSAIVKTQYAANIANFNIHIHKPYNRINCKTTKLLLAIQ